METSVHDRIELPVHPHVPPRRDSLPGSVSAEARCETPDNFNRILVLLMRPVVKKWHAQNRGFKLDAVRLTHLWWADNLYLFAHSLEEWLGIAKKANSEGLGYSALPAAAQSYIKKVEAIVGVQCTSIGVGPDRDATIDGV